VNFVTWYDAIRFANWLHNAQGGGDTETGAYTLGLLNSDGTPVNGDSITREPDAIWFLASEDEWYKAAYHQNDGATGNYFDYPISSNTAPTAEAPPGGSNSANYALAASGITDVGAYYDSDSPYGTFDQGGNLWEWNETAIGGSSRGVRGGSYSTPSDRLLATYRDSVDPALDSGAVGFRVATIPEPSTVVLAALGLVGLAALGWRRRKR
jgi:Sulfatase-modifying factor enzyme 1/PEP-CTERM motif